MDRPQFYSDYSGEFFNPNNRHYNEFVHPSRWPTEEKTITTANQYNLNNRNLQGGSRNSYEIHQQSQQHKNRKQLDIYDHYETYVPNFSYWCILIDHSIIIHA